MLLSVSCSLMSETGPRKGDIRDGGTDYQVISVASKENIPARRQLYGVAERPPVVKGQAYSGKIRERDMLTFVITDLSEQSPFYSAGSPYNYGPMEVPEDGRITLPYVGELHVLNRSLADVSDVFGGKIKPVSNTAQVAVVRGDRFSRTANVMGAVNDSGPVPLERSGINSLDLLAAAGGPTEAEHLFCYTLRRSGRDYQFDYEGFRKNSFPVEEGDLLTVSTDDRNRFHVMGAFLRAKTVPFPTPKPTLADALGAGTGLDERRSDPSGVFVFRKGSPDLVYTFNLREPSVIPLLQRFPIEGEDIVFVTEAPLARWNRMISQLLPTGISQGANAWARFN